EPPARLLPRPLAQEEAPQEAVLHAGDGTPPREGARPGRPPAPFDRRARVLRGDPRDAPQSLRSAGGREPGSREPGRRRQDELRGEIPEGGQNDPPRQLRASPRDARTGS